MRRHLPIDRKEFPYRARIIIDRPLLGADTMIWCVNNVEEFTWTFRQYERNHIKSRTYAFKSKLDLLAFKLKFNTV